MPLDRIIVALDLTRGRLGLALVDRLRAALGVKGVAGVVHACGAALVMSCAAAAWGVSGF